LAVLSLPAQLVFHAPPLQATKADDVIELLATCLKVQPSLQFNLQNGFAQSIYLKRKRKSYYFINYRFIL